MVTLVPRTGVPPNYIQNIVKLQNKEIFILQAIELSVTICI